jgi:MoxR-like ATPase
MPEPILVARRGTTECHLLPALANRHGLITGATGTGKTITLQTLAENIYFKAHGRFADLDQLDLLCSKLGVA